ncbi:uncharacterized protein LOC133825707 [Humulus lupulus]|uniref:uncharacterized protein LOC133825707 n=1 Tax=Humulus lupulus TaxID=3486 RepID=UPI002B40D7AE|nr:uncharacterized protein LOC133825707 [Humulus lupulus]
MHSGFTLVNFRDEATQDLILETGVIHFDKKPVLLRPWTTDMDSVRMVKSVPVWIRLNGLGLQYWGKNSLSALVSTIGKPIMVDKVTQSRAMVKYPPVLVDMEISDHPPKSIAYINERGQLVEQMVEYEWLPSKSAACAQLGHIVANCNKGKGVVWMKKTSVEKGGNSEQEVNGPEIDKQQVSGFAIPENREPIITVTDADDRGETLCTGIDSKESNIDQGSHSSSQLAGTGKKDSVGNWTTPKRRGPKQAMAAHHKAAVAPSKANLSNGYIVLQETGDGHMVINAYPNS